MSNKEEFQVGNITIRITKTAPQYLTEKVKLGAARAKSRQKQMK